MAEFANLQVNHHQAAEAALADGTPTSAPCLYSHKGALGHSLAASGLVAVVLNVLAHRHGVVDVCNLLEHLCRLAMQELAVGELGIKV